ncbi:hypothetical protein OOZ19_27365 [Saccharopolyspora sp. NFXS83]|uniref:hypothetical protein n=1 Tax=Saccharopolyspora sp. NFXS83 TaxID=2993560 RepID=UPI00224A7CD9|nr:hypothetical protein [Saccharopolyspora sp. NFXS83]MCX2733979.1 hypothetical protein [Saccharopolyspora sp. NFXS83]
MVHYGSYTRISHPPGPEHARPELVGPLLRDQLQVSEEDFWACVNRKTPRGFSVDPADSLPAELVRLLIHRVGVPEIEVKAMSKDAAIARLNAYWNRL